MNYYEAIINKATGSATKAKLREIDPTMFGIVSELLEGSSL